MDHKGLDNGMLHLENSPSSSYSWLKRDIKEVYTTSNTASKESKLTQTS